MIGKRSISFLLLSSLSLSPQFIITYAKASSSFSSLHDVPASLMEEGRYQATLGDCTACHTTPGRPQYSGGVSFALPIGQIYATNITPDKKYGIGDYSEKDFARAIRQGIRKDGSTLYPAMPYPSYARLSDHDIHTLYVYFHYGVSPQNISSPTNHIMWPLSMRWPLTLWRWFFAPNVQKAQHRTASEFKDPILSRGAYLVEGPGHCGACHTPRGITMAEKAQTAHDGSRFLSGGGIIDQWLAPSLRQENRTGLGRWSDDNIVEFLKTGRAPTGMSFGNMTPVIKHSTYAYSRADLQAIARYLRTLSARHLNEIPWQYDLSTTLNLQHANLSERGAQLYVDRCAACHRTDGHGYDRVFPPLAGNPVIMTKNPISIIHIIQTGDTLPGLQTAPSSFTMPDFIHTLNDRDIADVTSFIRHAWGNNAPPVTTQNVKKIRNNIH